MREKGFRILDHPADLGIEAYGKTLAEAFEQAALGLVSIIANASRVEARDSRNVTLQGSDWGHLLVRWLEEILYLYDGEGFLGGRFQVGRLETGRLEAVVYGEPLDPVRHQVRSDVKAVTYHQLNVCEKPGKSRVQVFLDI
ncbi:MAG TPA: archease [Terriglobia bacterium]|nr:archease [Terriglobia bacterium]